MSAFKKYFIDVYRFHYLDYHGRARRREYWLYTLFFYLIVFLMVFVAVPFGDSALLVVMIFLVLFVLLSIPPSICLTVRRLHDSGQSGLLYLLNFIPYVGPVVVFVFMCLDSTPGENKYGPNPKELGDLSEVFT
jgi:Predicted membrane protein